jgi:hypothetical protein
MAWMTFLNLPDGSRGRSSTSTTVHRSAGWSLSSAETVISSCAPGRSGPETMANREVVEHVLDDLERP